MPLAIVDDGGGVLIVVALQLYVHGREGEDENLIRDLGGDNTARSVLLFPSEQVRSGLNVGASPRWALE